MKRNQRRYRILAYKEYKNAKICVKCFTTENIYNLKLITMVKKEQKKRMVYVLIKTSGAAMGFGVEIDKSLKEIKKFYSTFGVIAILGGEQHEVMSAMSGLFLGKDMTEIINNYKNIKVVVTEDKAEIDILHKEYEKEQEMQKGVDKKTDGKFSKMMEAISGVKNSTNEADKLKGLDDILGIIKKKVFEKNPELKEIDESDMSSVSKMKAIAKSWSKEEHDSFEKKQKRDEIIKLIEELDENEDAEEQLKKGVILAKKLFEALNL